MELPRFLPAAEQVPPIPRTHAGVAGHNIPVGVLGSGIEQRAYGTLFGVWVLDTLVDTDTFVGVRR